MRLAIGSCALVTVLAAACANPDMPDQVDGKRLYRANCASCHGASGTGDGALAPDLSPAPSDLTVLARNNGGPFPVNEVLSQIDGYSRAATTSSAMPEFGLLFEGDLVPLETGDGIYTPTPRALVALLEYLETIQR